MDAGHEVLITKNHVEFYSSHSFNSFAYLTSPTISIHVYTFAMEVIPTSTIDADFIYINNLFAFVQFLKFSPSISKTGITYQISNTYHTTNIKYMDSLV